MLETNGKSAGPNVIRMSNPGQALVTATGRAGGRRPRTAAQREGLSGFAFIAPTAVLLSIFYLLPLVQTLLYSVTDWNPARSGLPEFVGLDNFVTLFTETDFPAALGVTGVMVLTVVPISMAIGLVLAALLHAPIRGRSTYRALIFLPFIAPTVGSALIFTYLLTPLGGGVVNALLGSLGLRPIAFLGTEPWGLVSVIVFCIWQQVGYTMIIYSSALSVIPISYFEAARLDGAGPIGQFFSISIPLVRSSTGFLAVTGVISSLQVFTQIYILSKGGPQNSTTTALYWIYEQGFTFFNGGLATAGSLVLVVVGIAATILQLRVLSRHAAIEMI
jgi:ABC-type sugar transport system permease subunit